MDQRLSVITLGVEDVPRAKAFYEQLGWKVAFTDGDIVMFQAGPMIVSLWSRAKLAEDSGVAAPPDGWGGFTLGYAVRSAAEVDELCGRAAEAGASVTRAPVEEVLRLLGRVRGPRRAHLGDRLDRVAHRARRRHAWSWRHDRRRSCAPTASRLPGAVETFPFEPGVAVFKAANGKMFGVCVTAAEPLAISVKCDPDLAVTLRARVRRRSSRATTSTSATGSRSRSARTVPTSACGSSSRTATTWSLPASAIPARGRVSYGERR